MSKPVSAQFQTLMGTRQFYAADLWTVNLANGAGTLYYCSGDQNINANGNTYLCGGTTGPYWDRTGSKAKFNWSTGTSVDELQVDVIPGSSTVLGLAFLNAVRRGVFDGAEVILERALMPTYGDTSRGLVRVFIGRMAPVVAGRSLITFSINSHLELLNLQFPRNLAQSTCMNNWGDTQCGIVQSSYRGSGTLTGTPTVAQFTTSTLGGTFATGTFDHGKIVFTSGVLNGYQATIKQATLSGSPSSATVFLAGYLPVAPSAGDSFFIYYGCNKSYTDANGCPKFSNTARFRGMPFTPQPATAV